MVKIGKGARVRLIEEYQPVIGLDVGSLGTVFAKLNAPDGRRFRDVIWDGFTNGHDGDVGDGSKNHWLVPKANLELVEACAEKVELAYPVGTKLRWLEKFEATMLTKDKVYEVKRVGIDYVGITDDRQRSGDHTWDITTIAGHFAVVPAYKSGDRVKLVYQEGSWSAPLGTIATVGARAVYYCDICKDYLLDVVWSDGGQHDGGYFLKSFEPFAGLVLHAGGYYKLRCGEVVGPLITNDGGDARFVWTVERPEIGDSWDVNGRWYYSREDDRDVVEEVVAPVFTAGTAFIDSALISAAEPFKAKAPIVAPAFVPQFKKGERLIVADDCGAFLSNGTVYVAIEDSYIDRDDTRERVRVTCDNGTTHNGWFVTRFAPAPTDFQVGDVVRRTSDPFAFMAVDTITTVKDANGGKVKIRVHNPDGNEWLDRGRFELVRRPPALPEPATLPVGTKVTVTGTVTGINASNRNVVLDAAPLARRSLDFPVNALTAA
jgi:hypothetical protein